VFGKWNRRRRHGRLSESGFDIIVSTECSARQQDLAGLDIGETARVRFLIRAGPVRSEYRGFAGPRCGRSAIRILDQDGVGVPGALRVLYLADPSCTPSGP
jgi:hypothetical protein